MRKTPAATPAGSARPSLRAGGRLARPSAPSPSYYYSYYTAGYLEERPSILAFYLVIFLTTLIIGGFAMTLFFVTSSSPLPKASNRSSKNRRRRRHKTTSSERPKHNATTTAERARRGNSDSTTASDGPDRTLDKSAPSRIDQTAERGPTELSSWVTLEQLTANTTGTTDTTFSAPSRAPVTTTPLGKWPGLVYDVPPADETNATGPSLSYDPEEIAGGRDTDSTSSTYSAPGPPPDTTTPIGEWPGLFGDVLPADDTNATGASFNYDPDEVAGRDTDSSSSTSSAPSPAAAKLENALISSNVYCVYSFRRQNSSEALARPRRARTS
ncbi:hypothetical protein V5799_005454 [Amblyomma americanum]|uniref:Uncharacterized protein n=1 Tax=Amblyomma americanum TaxID=6943 RepID=A0AAQ4DZ73_AMBAM